MREKKEKFLMNFVQTLNIDDFDYFDKIWETITKRKELRYWDYDIDSKKKLDVEI